MFHAADFPLMLAIALLAIAALCSAALFFQAVVNGFHVGSKLRVMVARTAELDRQFRQTQTEASESTARLMNSSYPYQ